jgi:hypothetical protein
MVSRVKWAISAGIEEGFVTHTEKQIEVLVMVTGQQFETDGITLGLTGLIFLCLGQQVAPLFRIAVYAGCISESVYIEAVLARLFFCTFFIKFTLEQTFREQVGDDFSATQEKIRLGLA